MMKGEIAGFAGAVLAAVTFGLNPLFALKLYAGGLSTPTVLFYRFGFGAGMVALLMLVKKKSFRIPRKYLLYIILLGLCLAGTSLGLFLSFRFMDAGIASTILFTYPVIVTVIMAVFFREHISPWMIASIVLSLSGVLVMCKTPSGAYLDIRGILLAVLSAFAYAVYMVIVRQSGLNRMQSETITFYAMIFSLPYFVVMPDFSYFLPVSNHIIMLNMIGLALFPAFLSFYFLAIGLRYIGATRTAVLGALEPLTAVCISIFVFGEAFTWRLMLGIIFVFSGVLLVIFADKLQEFSCRLHKSELH